MLHSYYSDYCIIQSVESMIKPVIVLLITGVILTIGGVFFLFYPEHTNSLHFQGEDIRIDRDSFGIPHIYASSRRGFLYAYGHLMSEDRLFQITFTRIFGEGRLSEYIGDRTLPVDINMRDLSLPETASNIVSLMKKEDYDSYLDFSAFSHGINEGVARRSVLPFEFYALGIEWEEWTVESTFLTVKLLEWSIAQNIVDEYLYSHFLSNHTKEEVEKIFPNTEQEWAFDSVTTVKDQDLPEKMKSSEYCYSLLKLKPIQIGQIISLGMPDLPLSMDGSNAWVVSGRHTESGKPILSADPHLQPKLPSPWYQMKVTYSHDNKTVNFAGIAMPGIPFAYGKTDYLAMAVTVLYSDTQDLYKQKIKGNQYLVDGNWKDLRIRNETILIKTKEGLKQYQHTVKFTHRGPVLHYIISRFGMFDLKGEDLSLAWTGYNQHHDNIPKFASHLEITNIDQLTVLLKNYTSFSPSLNFIMATADDHIIYRQTGSNALRMNVQSGSFVKDGTSSENDWLGFMPSEDQLLVIDPKSGILVSSNNRPASGSVNSGYFKYQSFTARADRLEESLKSQISKGNKITNEFARSLLLDTVDIYCRQILPQILAVVANSSPLLSFTCDFKSSSSQATMYELFMLQLWTLIKPRCTFNISMIAMYNTQQSIYNYIHEAYRGDQEKQGKMDSAWLNMEKRLTEFFKTEDSSRWAWGKFHRDLMKQLPLGENPVLGWFYNREADGWGNLNTPNIGMCTKTELGSFYTSFRANYRAIYDFGGPNWWILDGGASQNVLSQHYDDQWKLFIQQKMIQIDGPQQEDHEL